MDAAITAQRLVKAYGEVKALDGLSTTVERGSVFVNGIFADRVRGIGMKQGSGGMCKGGQFGDGWIVPVSLLACMTDTSSVLSVSAAARSGADNPVLVHRQDGDLDALCGGGCAGLQGARWPG